MASVNKVFLVGNVGRVDVKTFQDGGKVAEVSLATSTRYKDRNGTQHEDTQWHRLLIGGKLADVAEQYVQKGDPIWIEGRLKYRTYQTREGYDKEVAEIQVTEMQMLRAKGQGAPAQDPGAAPAPCPGTSAALAELMDGQDGTGDLPF